MIVLVTGADGFLGTNIVRMLLDSGFRVRAFVQPGRDLSNLAGLDVDIVRGDLLDGYSLHDAAKGSGSIIHAAANTSVWPSRSELVRRVNVDGTRAALEAAKSAHVRRFVHVGTAASFGSGTREHPGDDTKPFAGGRWKLDYIDSKTEAQRLVLEAAAAGDVPAIVINPTFMLGAWDSEPSSGRMILSVLEGRVPGASPGGKCYVAVADAARCALEALEAGTIGECHIMGCRNMDYSEAFSTIASVAAALAPRLDLPVLKPRAYRALPRSLVLAGGALSSLAGALTGRAPAISLEMARIGCSGEYYTGAKAARVFGVTWTPIETAIEEAILWFAARGYLDRILARRSNRIAKRANH